MQRKYFSALKMVEHEYNKKTPFSMTLKLYKVSLFFSCMSLFIVFTVSSIVLIRTWREYKNVLHLEACQASELDCLHKDNEKYRAHIIQLLNDDEFVEHIARQRIGYVENDEILFRFD